MPFTWVPGPGGPVLLKDPWVGDVDAQRRVEKIWIGDGDGVPLLVFDRLASTTTLTATAVSTSQIDLSWTATPGASKYVLEGTSGLLVNKGLLLSHSNTGLAANTFYAYRVDVYVGGVKIGESHANATTQAPTLVPKVWESRATGSASFTGTNATRSTASMYFGRYDSTWGTQKSQFWFDIPAEIRNCVSIDRIDLAVRGQHTFNGGGTDADLAVIHTAGYHGHSGPLRHDGRDWPFRVPRENWCGTWVAASGWNENLQVLSDPSRGMTLAEEFMVAGAVGFALLPRSTNQSEYGYCYGATNATWYPRIKIHYTVRTG